MRIRISLRAKFQFKLTIFTFLTKLLKNGISGQKREKWTSQSNSDIFELI